MTEVKSRETRKTKRERTTRQFSIESEKDTERFALQLAEKLEPGDVIAMIGDLGTGKTTLTKYIAKGLGIEENINSPTFTIVKEHRSGRLPLFHFDAYRLGSGEELLDIGADEYFYDGGVCVVEWADLVMDVIPEDAILIEIRYGEREGERLCKCTF